MLHIRRGSCVYEMGNFLYSLLFRNINVVVIGLDGAGKTTVLMKMFHGNPNPHAVVHTMPTLGFNVEKLTVSGLKVNTWDLGGQEKLREFWIYHMAHLDGLVYVVDSMDRKRLQTSKDELYRILDHPEVSQNKAPLLIMLNKCDHPDVTMEELDREFEVTTYISKSRPVKIVHTIATQDVGLRAGFEWLVSRL